MYVYEIEKPKVFSESGQRTFLEIRDRVNRKLKDSGAVSMGMAISGSTGDSWTMLACVDRMVELKEIREVTSGGCSGQDRVFVKVGDSCA